MQDILEQSLEKLCAERVKVTGASRTDAGVHALGQMAAFSTSASRTPDVVMKALNALLPADIRVLSSEISPDSFHPRYDAKRKTYFYLISLKGNTAFMHRYLWDLRMSLDLDAMAEAASALMGTHDFSSFRGAGCSARNPVRTIDLLTVERLSEIRFMTAAMRGDFMKIHIGANGFLRHMVRNIVGTLVETGKGRLKPGSLSEILASQDREAAGPTAPAEGLFLEQISY